MTHISVDPDGLDEYSVVFTSRSVNHMSRIFCEAMCDISTSLKKTYAADSVAIVPGGGTYGMEAIARLFGNGVKCLIVQNGWFSYRWQQILETGGISSDVIIMHATSEERDGIDKYRPVEITDVVQSILVEKPEVVFAPHVETSSGVLLPDDYLTQVASAVHSYGGILVLDCIASGAQWVDMKCIGVDVLITAPQKGWSSTPCAAAVLLSEHAGAIASSLKSSSFSCDLNKWLFIMREYEAGRYAYHATMPTDGLMQFRDAIVETRKVGIEALRCAQQELGGKIRAMLTRAGFISIAAEGFQSESVIVCHTDQAEIKNGSLFAQVGVQVAGGVPLMCGEPEGFSTFRIGLFGLDKLTNIDATVERLERAIKDVAAMV